MGLLQSLGLPAPSHPAIRPTPRDAAPDASPAPGSGAQPAPPGRKPARASAPPVTELAKWPAQAHRAWKRLDHVRQTAVAVQMASIYGQAFARDFVAAAKSGKTRLEAAHFITALAHQTRQAMEAAGYKLAQSASNGDLGQEWWVKPDGHEVFLLRKLGQAPSGTGPGVAPPDKKQTPPDQKRPPVEPPGTCSQDAREQLEMALQWAEAALAEARQAHPEIKAEKERMDKLNAMTQRLKDHLAHLEDTLKDVETAREALENSGCDLGKLDTARDDLEHEQIAFDVELGLHQNDIRKPIHVDVKDMPGGADDE
jgi:hypothetical protein